MKLKDMLALTVTPILRLRIIGCCGNDLWFEGYAILFQLNINGKYDDIQNCRVVHWFCSDKDELTVFCQ